MKNEAAAALGRMARGVPKKFSAESLERRRELARGLAAKRWRAPRKRTKT